MENKLEAVQDLHDWSLNCETARPWFVFCDLIGWGSYEGSGSLAVWTKPEAELGLLELDYLGDALKIYALYPIEVKNLVAQLVAKDLKEDTYAWLR